MMYSICGKVLLKTPVVVVLESAGIGWEINIPVSSYDKISNVGSESLLYTHLHYSQDGAKLFGFSTNTERELFQMLISISGVGPKIAISIISTLSISAFCKSIRNNDEHILTKVPGLGKKSAQRLIIELRDKIDRLTVEDEYTDLQAMDISSIEVESALISLGFNTKDIRRELTEIKKEGIELPLEQMIKETIKRLYQRNK